MLLIQVKKRRFAALFVTVADVNRRVKLPGAVMLFAAFGLSLAACSSDDTVTEYSGLFADYVHACAAIAGQGDLRDDLGTISTIKISDITAEQRIETDGIYYDVSGRTYVWGANPDGNGRRAFAWTCVVDSDARSGPIASLTATLTKFDREE